MQNFKITIRSYPKTSLGEQYGKKVTATWQAATIHRFEAAPQNSTRGLDGSPVPPLQPTPCAQIFTWDLRHLSAVVLYMHVWQYDHCPLGWLGLQASGPIVHWWSRKWWDPSSLSHEVGDHALGLRVQTLRSACPSPSGRPHTRLLLVTFVLQ